MMPPQEKKMDLELFSKQQDIRYMIQLLGELNSFLEKAKNDDSKRFQIIEGNLFGIRLKEIQGLLNSIKEANQNDTRQTHASWN